MGVAVLVGSFGLALRHTWITAIPLTSGDWQWPDHGRISSWFPWPPIWDATINFGLPRFAESYRAPALSAAAFLLRLGIDWGVSEKVLYFLPLAVLLPVGAWLLAREVLGPTRWALLAPLLLVGNTYVLVESNGHVPILLADAISCLSLVALMQCMKKSSWLWAIVTGLLMGVESAFELRIVYITAVLMVLYYVVLAAYDPSWRNLARRAALGIVAGFTFLATQAYWVLPLLTYHGTPGIPTPQVPDFPIIDLAHGLAGVEPYWTGAQPAHLVAAPLDPTLLILPLLALLPLVARRLRKEVIWLVVCALLFAFWAKTDTAPLGGVYDWMYSHVPGWKLWREGSKFLFVVVIASAILVPAAVQMGMKWAARNDHLHIGRLMAAGVVSIALLLSAGPLAVLEQGTLGSTTVPTPEPSSFKDLSGLVDADPQGGSILWFGGPEITRLARIHRFNVASVAHPLVRLTGTPGTKKADPFIRFCADAAQPYCYLDDQMFPLLVQQSGARYIVAPQAPEIGEIPAGISRSWLRDRLYAMYGQPQKIGAGRPDELNVWRVSPAPAVAGYAGVAYVDSGPWSTKASLPALRALGVPAVYRQTLGEEAVLPGRHTPPDSVAVLPVLSGAVWSSVPRRVALLATGVGPILALDVAGKRLRLPIIQPVPRLPGWSLYGPLDVPAGSSTVGQDSAAPGPMIEWSTLTAGLLTGQPIAPDSVVESSWSEQVTANWSGPAPRWIELRRTFDVGWTLSQSNAQFVADGLYNVYHLEAQPARSASSARLRFEYSTVPWERIGLTLSVLAVAVGLLAIGALARYRKRRAGPTPATEEEPEVIELAATGGARLAVALGYAGLVLLVLAGGAVFARWTGLPSSNPSLFPDNDPYRLDIGFTAAGMAFLGAGVVIKLVEASLDGRGPRLSWHRKPSKKLIAGVVGVLLLAGCQLSTPPQSTDTLLLHGQIQRLSGRWDACIRDYSEALRRDDTLVVAYIGRASCSLGRTGDDIAPVHDLSRAIVLAPGDPTLLIDRAVGDVAIGDIAAAVSDLRLAAAYPGARDVDYLAVIDRLLVIPASAEAQQVAAQGMKQFPRSPLIPAGRASVDVALEQEDAAIKDFALADQLAVLSADRAIVLARRGQYEVLRHMYTAAVTDLTESARLNSANYQVYADLARAHLGQDETQTAISDLRSAIGAYEGEVAGDAQPFGIEGTIKASLYELLGRTEFAAHDAAHAVVDFRSALASLPPTASDLASRIRDEIASVGAEAP